MFGRFDDRSYEELGKIFVRWQKVYGEKWDTKSIEILRFFVQQNAASTYQCFKYLNEKKKIKISYKNVHKKIGKLLSLQLIMQNNQRSDSKDNEYLRNVTIYKHGAIYYKLSSLGLFYIISNKIIVNDFWEIYTSLVMNHHDFVIYKNILYPHIPLKILREIKSEFIWHLILAYIEDCCVVIQNVFEYIFKQDYIAEPMKKIGGILYCSPFFSELVLEEFKMNKSFFSLDSLDKEVKKPYKLNQEIILDENNKEILKVLADIHFDNTLYFKISEMGTTNNEKKLQIFKDTYRDPTNLIFEFGIENKEKHNLQYFKDSYIPMTWNKLLKWYLEGGDYLAELTNKLIELIVNMLSVKYEIILSSSEKDGPQGNNVLNDLQLLRNNNHFFDTFYTIKEYIQDNFKNFEQMKKS